MPRTQRRDTPDQRSRCRFKTCRKPVHTHGKNFLFFLEGRDNFALRKAEESPLVAKCRVMRSASGERHGLRWRENGLLCIVCQKCSLKVVKRHTRNAEPSEAYAAAEAERREQQKVKLCGVCLCVFTSVQPCRLVCSPHFPPRNSPQFVRRASRTAGGSTG